MGRLGCLIRLQAKVNKNSNFKAGLLHFNPIYQPLRSGRIWHKVNFKVFLGPKAEKPSLSYDLPIAGGRIIGFIPFPRVLEVWEMQSASSRIWTRVAVSISDDDNYYTTGTSILIHFIFAYENTSHKQTKSINFLYINISGIFILLTEMYLKFSQEETSSCCTASLTLACLDSVEILFLRTVSKQRRFLLVWRIFMQNLAWALMCVKRIIGSMKETCKSAETNKWDLRQTVHRFQVSRFMG